MKQQFDLFDQPTDVVLFPLARQRNTVRVAVRVLEECAPGREREHAWFELKSAFVARLKTLGADGNTIAGELAAFRTAIQQERARQLVWGRPASHGGARCPPWVGSFAPRRPIRGAAAAQ